jgi:hypothetical protein
MTQPDLEIEAVLGQRLAGLGALGCALGGASGAGAGAAWAAKRLKTETAADTRRFDPRRSGDVLASLSRLLECAPEYQRPDGQDGTATLRGVIGSGFGRMNPTYILAVVDTAGGSVGIAAHAKEGVIKQRSAEKAVQRVIAELPT